MLRDFKYCFFRKSHDIVILCINTINCSCSRCCCRYVVVITILSVRILHFIAHKLACRRTHVHSCRNPFFAALSVKVHTPFIIGTWLLLCDLLFILYGFRRKFVIIRHVVHIFIFIMIIFTTPSIYSLIIIRLIATISIILSVLAHSTNIIVSLLFNFRVQFLKS
jgi:hypothetical protein